MPGGIQLFANALNMSEAELFKLMEDGKAISADILPKVAKEMRKVANSGGALANKLNSARVAQGRFFNQLEQGQNRIFEGGFGQGIAGMFNELSDVLKDNGYTLDEMGKIFNRVFKGITAVIKILTPILESVIRAMGTVTDLLAWFANNQGTAVIAGIGAMALGLTKAAKAAGGLGAALAIALRSPMVMLMTLVALIDEVRGFFDENVHGLMDDKSLSAEEQKIIHAKRRVNFGMDSEKDREYLKSKGVDTSSSGIMQTIQSVVPFASVMANTQVAVSNLNAWLERTYSEGSSKADKMPATVNFNITSTDPVEAGKEVKKALDNTFSLQMMGGF